VSDTPGPSGSRTVSIFVADGIQVLRVHKEIRTGATLDSVVDYTPGFARFDATWLEMAVGDAMDLGYRRVEVDGQGSLVSDEQRTHTYQVLGSDEQVTVPAGTFDHCVQVQRERVRPPGNAPAADDLTTFWFCPDVGKVKDVDVGTGKSEVLVSCSLPACNG